MCYNYKCSIDLRVVVFFIVVANVAGIISLAAQKL
jgi:hypothetical protein